LEDHVPIYEYRCSSCGFQKDYLQKISDPLLSSCPECGNASFRKMLTAAGFQLKGSGWYASDFKGNGAKPQKDKTEPAKATESAKAEAPACGAGACAACPVAVSGS
jgi:putative FmdB family regulatory protein